MPTKYFCSSGEDTFLLNSKSTAAYKYARDHAQSFAFDEERAQFIAIFTMEWIISCFVQCHIRMTC